MTSMIYPTTNPAMSETMVVARAEGPYIYDKQGKRYLEGMAGLWCTALGYGNEEIIEALASGTWDGHRCCSSMDNTFEPRYARPDTGEVYSVDQMDARQHSLHRLSRNG